MDRQWKSLISTTGLQLFLMYCTVYSVQCTVYSVQGTVYIFNFFFVIFCSGWTNNEKVLKAPHAYLFSIMQQESASLGVWVLVGGSTLWAPPPHLLLKTQHCQIFLTPLSSNTINFNMFEQEILHWSWCVFLVTYCLKCVDLLEFSVLCCHIFGVWPP